MAIRSLLENSSGPKRCSEKKNAGPIHEEYTEIDNYLKTVL